MLLIVRYSGKFETRYKPDSRSYIRYIADIYPALLDLEPAVDAQLNSRQWLVKKEREIEAKRASAAQVKSWVKEPGLSKENLARLFRKWRTPGYPLFLIFCHKVSPDLALLPAIQYLLLSSSIFFFYGSMTLLGMRKSAAFCASSVIFYTTAATSLTNTVMSDSPAIAMGIFSAGFVLRTAAVPRRPLPLAGLALSVFTALLIRPAYMFLLPWAPLMLVCLGWLRSLYGGGDPGFFRLMRHAVVAVIVIMIPISCYSMFRHWVTGKPGSAGFGGANLIGITMQILPEDKIENLPEELRAPAAEILDIQYRKFRPPLEFTNDRLSWENYGLLHDRYAFAIFGNSYRVIRKYSVNKKGGVDRDQLDRLFQEISVEALKAAPARYFNVVEMSFIKGIYNTFELDKAMRIICIGGLALSAAGLAVIFLGDKKAGRRFSLTRNTRLEILALMLLSVTFFLAKHCLVILVEIPIQRYMLAAGVLIPALMAGAAAAIWTDVFVRKNNLSE